MGETEVTPVEIARMAGVGRAAVSNWRRRYEDFPQPVGGTATSPRFALAEVEEWLRRQGKVSELPAEERAWQEIRALASDHDLPEAVRRAGDLLLAGTPGHKDAALRHALTEIAAERGVADTYERLLGRLHEATRLPRVPAPVADLMANLLGPSPASVYDPACGTGGLLVAAAARHPEAEIRGDDPDPTLLALARLRLTVHQATRVEFGRSDLRHPPDPPVTAGAVLCVPPPTDRDWITEDLAYDTRWRYGVPPRAEPELAWVQHSLASLRPGGRAVLLLPPAVGARPSGRRIRAELLRRGALRAVVGLPAGAAPPYHLGLHLWVLRHPAADQDADRFLIAELASDSDWAEQAAALVTALDAVDRGDDLPDRPELRARVLRVMDLLDDVVDLTPGRRLRSEPEPVDPARVTRLRERLSQRLGRLGELLPTFHTTTTAGDLPTITIGDLGRTGALTVTVRSAAQDLAEADQSGHDGVPVWRARDVVAGRGPGAWAPAERVPPDAVRVETGDVVAPALGNQLVARVVTDAEAGAILGPHLYLLRPDPAVLDPWFLAGFLRRDSNTHRAGSLGSIQRYDIRRAHVPRIPVEDQRAYGELFCQLAEFTAVLEGVVSGAGELSRHLADGLATGTLQPPRDIVRGDGSQQEEQRER